MAQKKYAMNENGRACVLSCGRQSLDFLGMVYFPLISSPSDTRSAAWASTGLYASSFLEDPPQILERCKCGLSLTRYDFCCAMPLRLEL